VPSFSLYALLTSQQQATQRAGQRSLKKYQKTAILAASRQYYSAADGPASTSQA